MPTPSTRTPVRIARGSYSNLNSSISDLGDGEIVYAEDQDKLYVKEGSSLVVLTQPAASPTFTGDVTFTGASSNGIWDASANAFVANVTGDVSGSSGSCTGNAATATALATARTIGGTSFDGSANIDVALATAATNVTVADESSDTTCFPLFATAATGDLPPKSGTNLTFNSSTGELEADILKDSKGDVRDIPTNAGSSQMTIAASDAGKVVATTTGGWIIPATLAAGNTFTLLNDSASAQNITATALTYLYNTADGANIKDDTIALGARGMATIWMGSSSSGYIQSAALTVS